MANYKVSVIIPAYNSEKFILDTVNSVLNQNIDSIEIIIVNDGSTDKTLEILKSVEHKVNVYTRTNAGVSAARNFGKEMATGEYICFLDSDDILSSDFISSKVSLLDNSPEYDFCCGDVVTIDENGNYLGMQYKGVSSGFFEKILYYDKRYVTCPSNYLFRSSFLNTNQINFNQTLSSSADRHFLLSLSYFGKCGYIKEVGKLYYRVHNKSMSHQLSEKLLQDNYLYMQIILNDIRIPIVFKSHFKFKVNYILSGGFFHLGHYFKAFKFAISSFLSSPKSFIKTITSKGKCVE